MLKQLQCLIDNGDLEGLSLALSEVENAEDEQEKYMIQLESEKALMISKINELGHEVTRASSGPINMPYWAMSMFFRLGFCSNHETHDFSLT